MAAAYPTENGANEERVKGNVKWFDSTKGFGFIVYNGQDVFFHHSAVQSEAAPKLDEGQEVMFTYYMDKGKPKGKNVTDPEGNQFPQTHPTRQNPTWLKRLSENTRLQLGSCKWFDCKKGFGFIEPEDHSGEVFVHNAEINATKFRALKEGEPVEFILELVEKDGKMTRQAKQVTGPGGNPVTYVNPNFQQQQKFQDQSSIFGDVISYAAVPVGATDAAFGGAYQIQQQAAYAPAGAQYTAYDPYGTNPSAKFAAAQTSQYAAVNNARAAVGARVNANNGTVKWFARDKGFGFINGTDGREYFVHQNSLQMQPGVEPNLIPNDSVEFYVEIKGTQHRAVNVTGPRGALLGRMGSGVQGGGAEMYGGGNPYDAYGYDPSQNRKTDNVMMSDTTKRAKLTPDMYQQSHPAANQVYRPAAGARLAPAQPGSGAAVYSPYDMGSTGYGALASGGVTAGSVSYSQQAMNPYV